MPLKTRRPTGIPSWPIVLIAGREGAGKTWAAVEASAAPHITRTLFISVGEDDPDEYARIPGADFEIVEHDGTARGVIQAAEDVAAEGDEHTLLIVDSMSRFWQALSDDAQEEANGRARRKAQRQGRAVFDGDVPIGMDLWTKAAKRSNRLMNAIRAHRGPSVLTARLEQVAIVANGEPTGEKTWKIQGHKSLPFDVSVIVEMPTRGTVLVTKVKSAVFKLDEPRPWRTEKAGPFAIATLHKTMGLLDSPTAPRAHTDTVPEAQEITEDVAEPQASAEHTEWSGAQSSA